MPFMFYHATNYIQTFSYNSCHIIYHSNQYCFFPTVHDGTSQHTPTATEWVWPPDNKMRRGRSARATRHDLPPKQFTLRDVIQRQNITQVTSGHFFIFYFWLERI